MIGRNRIRAACATAASFAQPCTLQFIRELDDQNSVFGNKADQSHQSDLGVDVERVVQPSVKNLPNGIFKNMNTAAPNKREWHRTEQNDQRIAEAVKLGSENEENQHNREHENSEKTVSLRSKLSRATGVIDDIARRQDLRALHFP